jgi:hypothetical protein
MLRDYFTDATDLLEKLPGRTLLRYFRTYQAISAGESLWDLPADELKRRDWMRPLLYNVSETLLSGSITVALTSVLAWFFRLSLPEEPQSSTMADRITQSVAAYVSGFAVPLCALAVATLSARASLWPADRTRASLRKARDAYLYLDGTFGLIPAIISGLAITIGTLLIARSISNETGLATTVIGIGLIYLVPLGTTGSLYWIRIPRLLFTVNAYQDDAEAMDRDPLAPHRKPVDAPWGRYCFALFWSVPIALLVLSLAFGLVALGIGESAAFIADFASRFRAA